MFFGSISRLKPVFVTPKTHKERHLIPTVKYGGGSLSGAGSNWGHFLVALVRMNDLKLPKTWWNQLTDYSLASA